MLFGPFKWMFDRSVEIAAWRRTSYTAATKDLVAAWREAKLDAKEKIFPILATLYFDGNPDLFPAISALVDAIVEKDSSAEKKLSALLEKMRETAVLGNVRHNHMSKGSNREALISKLLGS
ncbi:hypothetical protein F4693_000277 [Sphingomonas endophytica]|uniref:Uncharacterized protein n=1 Tax=Sphingomonas endophytica TaxID=869719 RepID=A0A7X0MNA5_9SPHN|nr:hypothetical protein [Sphingomonas endophytica]MBB6503328.1 hypothetical protein [Sphingomonas endophytica]